MPKRRLITYMYHRADEGNEVVLNEGGGGEGGWTGEARVGARGDAGEEDIGRW